MSTFAERLLRYIEYKGTTVYQVNKCAGLSTGLLIKALRDNKNMSTSNVEQILLAYPDLNADWLLTGRGAMILDNTPPPPPLPPLPEDLAASLYRCIIWHLLLQDSYAETMHRLDEILALLTSVQERATDLRDQLLRLSSLLKANYEFQPVDHGLYEMSLRIAAGDDGKNIPTQLKDHFDVSAALREHLGL